MRGTRRRLVLADVPAHVEPCKVADAKRPHGKSELLDRLVDLLRQRAFLEQEARFPEIAVQHAVADEAVAHARHHTDLLDRLRQLHGGRQHIPGGFLNPQKIPRLLRAQKKTPTATPSTPPPITTPITPPAS